MDKFCELQIVHVNRRHSSVNICKNSMHYIRLSGIDGEGIKTKEMMPKASSCVVHSSVNFPDPPCKVIIVIQTLSNASHIHKNKRNLQSQNYSATNHSFFPSQTVAVGSVLSPPAASAAAALSSHNFFFCIAISMCFVSLFFMDSNLLSIKTAGIARNPPPTFFTPSQSSFLAREK